jgi:hypothetical protein
MLWASGVEAFVVLRDEGGTIMATGTDGAGQSGSNIGLCVLSGVRCCKPSISTTSIDMVNGSSKAMTKSLKPQPRPKLA